MQTFHRLAAVFISLIFSSSDRPLLAQIQPDNTLGVEQSLVATGIIQGLPSEVINGGARRGVNLFHSFFNFNVANGQRVYFGNPAGILNILTRVTGNTPSAILGTLGVDGGANLFLLNPNGILFGANSRLDIRGSFIATTANSFTFPDGSQFSAVQPDAPPLLIINITPGLQYGTSPANITNAGKLEVGGNLMLAGGNIITTGQLRASGDLTLSAQNTVQIRDSVSAPFIAQAGGTLLVQGNRTVDIFALHHPNSGLFSGGDMVLRSPTSVIGDAHYWTDGNFRIEQLNHQLGNLISPNDPIIRASGDVTLNGYIGASLHIFAGGKVTITGGVTITGSGTPADTIQETITLANGKTLNIDGAAVPTLDIRAGTKAFGAPGVTTASVFFTTPVGSLAPANLILPATSADIVIGDINMTVPNGVVFLTNQYAPHPTLPGGNITVNGTNFFGTGRGIQTNLAAGSSGSVTIDARDSILLNASINTSSATGNAGDIQLAAKNNITVQNGAQLSTNTFGSGTGGNMQIDARQLTLQNNAQLSALTGDDLRNNSLATTNTGAGGNITLNISDSINLLNQSVITVQTNQLSSGNAGTLSIKANQLNVQDGSLISGVTLGQGRGGNLRLDIADALTLTGTDTANTQTGIFLNSFNSGNAGSLEILNARQLTVQGGALISASASATGQAGNINIDMPDGIVQVKGVSNNPGRQTASSILSETQNSGRAGDIRVNARQVLIQDGGQISAQTIATGQAGTLAVKASERIEVSGTNGSFASRLFFNSADVGNAGGIRINTNRLALTDGGQITVSGTGTGISGNIDVVADSISLINRGKIRATTTLSEGGNIFLSLSNPGVSIYMENNSEISAEAFQFANAGTLTINARGSIISRSLADNNDIVANAIYGRGGRIGASATLILGFRQFQGQRTPESDFTSRSGNPFFPGELTLNKLEDPTPQPLPQDFLTNQLALGCAASPGVASSVRPANRFVYAGRGGLPPNPSEAFSGSALWEDGRSPSVSSTPSSPQNQVAAPTAIIEATGWVREADGTISLVAAGASSNLSFQTAFQCDGQTSR